MTEHSIVLLKLWKKLEKICSRTIAHSKINDINPTLRTDKANANLINAEVTELLRTCEEKIITHPNIKE